MPAGSVVPAMRLLVVRGFARYMAGIDPRTEVPPTGLIRLRRHRRPPFIYTDDQVLALMERARTGIRQRLVAATYETLIGLLAATGMRISEAIKLDRRRHRLAAGVLLVRESKFNKSRYLPVHASTLDALERYARERDRALPEPTRSELLRLAAPTTARRLRRPRDVSTALPDATGVGADAPFPPRLHDLRHTMAVRTLLGWYHDGVDVHSRLPALSTYLGHRTPPTPTTTSRPHRSCLRAAGMLDAAQQARS